MIQLFNMDCMDYLKSLPDNAFKLAVVDPPYGNPDDSVRFRGGLGSKSTRKYPPPPADITDSEKGLTDIRNLHGRFKRYQNPMEGTIPKAPIEWDIAPSEEYFEELFRVSENQIIWGGNYFYLPPTRCFLIWKKLSISESFSMAMAEYAWTSFNENAKVFEHTPQGDKKDCRFHPCLPYNEKVFFEHQWKKIQDVKIGDTNEFGSVSCISIHEATHLVEIECEGQKTISTWNHPFLIKRGKEIYWINAEQITKKDELIWIKSTKRHVRDICDTEKIVVGDLGWSIILFGKSIMVRFRRVCKYIIKILIKPTIILKTCSLLLPLSTSGCTRIASLKKVFGIRGVKYVENIRPAQKNTGIFVKGGSREESVNRALCKKSSMNVKCVFQKVGNVKHTHQKTKVYNLTIDGIPAFETLCGISHNTQKPIELYSWIFNRYAKQGDNILDTHLGSGSSAIAAYELGFDFTGIEINEYYFKKAKERLDLRMAQGKLF